MPKSLTRGPARLLVLAVALGGPLAVVDTADAAGQFTPGDPTAVTAAAVEGAPDAVLVDWEGSELEETAPLDDIQQTMDEPSTDEPSTD